MHMAAAAAGLPSAQAMVPVATLWHAGSEYASTPEEDEDIAAVAGLAAPAPRPCCVLCGRARLAAGNRGIDAIAA